MFTKFDSLCPELDPMGVIVPDLVRIAWGVCHSSYNDVVDEEGNRREAE